MLAHFKARINQALARWLPGLQIRCTNHTRIALSLICCLTNLLRTQDLSNPDLMFDCMWDIPGLAFRVRGDLEMRAHMRSYRLEITPPTDSGKRGDSALNCRILLEWLEATSG
jgi:hypothetical protein